MYVVKDLVPDMNNFYDQYKSVQPWLQLKETTEHTYAERQDGLKVFNETYQVPNRTDNRFLLALIPSTGAEMPPPAGALLQLLLLREPLSPLLLLQRGLLAVLALHFAAQRGDLALQLLVQVRLLEQRLLQHGRGDPLLLTGASGGRGGGAWRLARVPLDRVDVPFDRLDRGDGNVISDSRMDLIREGLEVLLDGKSDRAEQIQMIFSRPYEDDWQKTFGF